MEVQDNQGFSMIHCATAANNLTLLQELLPVPNTEAVNAKTSEGITPLMLACEKNHPDVVLLLLQKGAAVDERSDKGLTAAHFCALSNDINSLHHLIDYKADLSKATERGSTPLMLACAKGYVSIVTALLRNTCKSKLKNEITSALKLRNLTGQPSCLGLLATPKGMDINAGNENGETCLMMACEKGSVEIVRILLDEGADPNGADQNGVTPLMICCRRGQERIIPLLLRKGVLVDQKNNEGDTALHICVRHYREFSGHKKCLEQLLSTGVCLDMKVRRHSRSQSLSTVSLPPPPLAQPIPPLLDLRSTPISFSYLSVIRCVIAWHQMCSVCRKVVNKTCKGCFFSGVFSSLNPLYFPL